MRTHDKVLLYLQDSHVISKGQEPWYPDLEYRLLQLSDYGKLFHCPMQSCNLCYITDLTESE